MSNKMLFQQFFIVACNQSKSFHIMFREQRYTFPERRHIFVGYFHRTLDKNLNDLKADLPLIYVTREDYIRVSSSPLG